MSNPIRDWFNDDRSYAIGVSLYEVYGQDAALRRALQQGESEYRKQRLTDALRDLMPLAEHCTASTLAPAPAAADPEEIADVPETVNGDDPYRDKWHPIYAEMNMLRHSLIGASSDEERGKMAHRILKLERECMKWWERRKHYQATGVLLEDTAPASDALTDINAAHRRLMTARTLLTKAKKLVDDPKKGIDAQARVLKYEAEISELENLLKNG